MSAIESLLNKAAGVVNALVAMTAAAEEDRARAEEQSQQSEGKPGLLQDTTRDELERVQEENNDLLQSYSQLQDIRAGEQAAARKVVAQLQDDVAAERQVASAVTAELCSLAGELVQLGASYVADDPQGELAEHHTALRDALEAEPVDGAHGRMR